MIFVMQKAMISINYLDRVMITRISPYLRARIYMQFNGLCAYSGKDLGYDWQIDHIIPKTMKLQSYHGIEFHNDFRNLVPALKIVNHYKRNRTLEEFRDLMMTFHFRLAKLPKKTSLLSTEKRIKYMNDIADAFGITIDKQFCGKFHFELLEKE